MTASSARAAGNPACEFLRSYTSGFPRLPPRWFDRAVHWPQPSLVFARSHGSHTVARRASVGERP